MTDVSDPGAVPNGVDLSRSAAAAPLPVGPAAVLPVAMVINRSWSIADRGLVGEFDDALQRWCSVLRRRPAVGASAVAAIVGMGREHVVPSVSRDGASRGVSGHRVGIPDAAPERVTLLGDSLILALKLIDELVGELDTQQRSCHLPHVVVVCDGSPTGVGSEADNRLWRRALADLHQRVVANRLVCSAIGFGTADPVLLREIAAESSVYLGSGVSLDQLLNLASDAVEPSRGENYFARFRGNA